MTDENNKELLTAIETLNARIERQNDLLASFLKNQSSFRARLIAGLWTGLGTVLGATVIVSGIVLMLKPLSKTDWIGPIVDKVINALENRGGISKPHRNEVPPNSSNNQPNAENSPGSSAE